MDGLSTRQSEQRIQADCYIWFHNEYPFYRGLLCYNLGNSQGRAEGSRNRAMGLQPGRSDMVLYWQGRAYFIEIKASEGKQSKKQQHWQDVVEKHGFRYNIASSLDEFQKIIHDILRI